MMNLTPTANRRNSQMSEPPPDANRVQSLTNCLAAIQAGYFLVTGIWPLVSYRSFERVSGSKVDDWLVKTVGIQVSVVGATLALASKNKRVTPEIELLAVGSALGLAAIDVVYATRHRISRIYFADAAAEIGLSACWAILRRNRSIRGDSVDDTD
jgi:hypothetical protein